MGHRLKTILFLILAIFLATTPVLDVSARKKHLNYELEAKLREHFWWRADSVDYEKEEEEEEIECEEGYVATNATAYLEDKGENAQTVFSYLTQNGYSITAAAAIMGNLRAEGGADFNPRQLEIGKNAQYPGDIAPENFVAYDLENNKKTYTGGLGLAQWTSAGRVKNLQEYADKNNLPVTSLSAQAGFLVEELNAYGVTPEKLNSMSLRDATSYVLKNYEIPLHMEESVVDTRTKFAESFLSYEPGSVDFSNADQYANGEICISEEDAEKEYQEEYEQIDKEELIAMLQDGGLTREEAEAVIAKYKTVTPDQYDYYNIDGDVHNGTQSALQNCVAFVRWYVKEYYGYDLGKGSGNGIQVVSSIMGDKPAHQVPVAGAVVSYPTSTSSAGHTAIVLGINGDEMYLGEASYNKGYIRVNTVNTKDYTGGNYKYAYPEDMMGGQ